jgi:uncharacterized membrane protein
MKKNNSDKNLIVLTVTMVVFIFVALVLYSRYADNQELISVKINRVTSEQLNSKTLDLSVLNDPRFVRLKKINIDIPSINKINTGNENPFSKEK